MKTVGTLTGIGIDTYAFRYGQMSEWFKEALRKSVYSLVQIQLWLLFTGIYLSRLERRTVNPQVGGSKPSIPALEKATVEETEGTANAIVRVSVSGS